MWRSTARAGLVPVDPRLGLFDLGGVGDALFALFGQLQPAALQRAHRAHHQVGPERRQRVMQIGRRHRIRDRQPLGHRDVAGIEADIHLHHHHAALGIARHDGAVDRGGAAPARQQRGMQIEAAELRGVENGLGQDHAIGDDHGGIGVVGAKFLQRFRRLQGRRRQYGDTEPPRLLLDRGRLQLHAAPGGLCRAGIDRRDLVAMGDEFQQRRHREIGRAHEDQAERHDVELS